MHAVVLSFFPHVEIRKSEIFSLSAVNPDRTIRKSLMKGEFSTEITSYYYHSQRVSRAVGTHLPVAVRKPGWPSKSKVPFYGGAKVV